MALEDQLWDRSRLAYAEVPATGRKTLTVNSGTAIELGDTGLRDLSGMYQAGAVSSGRVLVHRVGNVVTWIFENVLLASPATHPWTIFASSSALSGFVHDVSAQSTTAMAGTSGQARILVNPSGSVQFHYGQSTIAYVATITFVTTKPWPTALPGVANGQPVGV